MTTANARPAEDAFRTALAEMILWLQEDYGFSLGEAYLFLGQVLEARCTQFVNPTFSYVAKVNRIYLPCEAVGPLKEVDTWISGCLATSL